MYIVDRNKDYYDYLSHVYGVDKGIVFDRRGSENITDEHLIGLCDMRNNDDTISLLFIEIGACHYLIKVHNFKFKKWSVIDGYKVKSFDVELVRSYPVSQNRFGSPISIHEANNYQWFRWNWRNYRRHGAESFDVPSLDELVRYIKPTIDNSNRSIMLPILKDTSITKILDPQTIWMNIQTYISSLDNDKDVSLDMTDKEKATTHGFDKHSFRHPVKTGDLK